MHKITSSDVGFEAELLLLYNIQKISMFGPNEETRQIIGYEVSCVNANMTHFPIHVEFVEFLIETPDEQRAVKISGYLSEIKAEPAPWPQMDGYGNKFFFKIRTVK